MSFGEYQQAGFMGVWGGGGGVKAFTRKINRVNSEFSLSAWRNSVLVLLA
jgi:hypothetical protein